MGVSNPGGGLSVVYADLIADDAPSHGWAMQDAAGASALAAAYGGVDISSLTGITTGLADIPLYPGARAARSNGGNTDVAVSASASALSALNGQHTAPWSMELWAYVPVNTRGLLMYVGKETVVGEGWGIGVGGASPAAAVSDRVHVGLDKRGAFHGFNGGSTAGAGEVAASLAAECALHGIVTGAPGAHWHHLYFFHNVESEARLLIDGTKLAKFGSDGDANHTAFGASSRVSFFNAPTVPAVGSRCDSTIRICHAYVYNRTLPLHRIRARTEAVNLLNL